MSWKDQQNEAQVALCGGQINHHRYGSHSKRHHWGTSICTRGRKHLKSLQILPGSPPYKNIQDAFQATKGNSVNSFIVFFFYNNKFSEREREKKKLIIQMISAYDYCHLVTSHISKTLNSRYNSRFELREHHTSGKIDKMTQMSIWEHFRRSWGSAYTTRPIVFLVTKRYCRLQV